MYERPRENWHSLRALFSFFFYSIYLLSGMCTSKREISGESERRDSERCCPI